MAEYANEHMTKEEINKYQIDNMLYFSTTPFINIKCPVSYDNKKCLMENKESCRSCEYYNPLRMLYEKELNPDLTFALPMPVLLEDARIQLG